MKRFFLSAAAFFAICGPLRGDDAQFIRVDEDAKAARLQTAVTRFEKNGAKVDLIGAVHIGDRKYYEALNERFAGYEVLLFEMIGGDDIKPEPQQEEGEGSLLHVIYDNAARVLGLVGQVDHIDYHAKNFLHADLSIREFTEKQEERGESIFKFMLSAEQTGKVPDPLKFVYGLFAKRPDLLKLSLIHTLGGGDDQIASLAGDNVIIGDRNVRCLEVMDRELAAGRKSVGIFYGAAHYPDMQRRLLEQGFVRTNHEWVTAWNVLKPIRKQSAIRDLPEE
jgi:hypothetical protein